MTGFSDSLHAQLKLAKNKKGEVASQFKRTPKDSAEYAQLIAAMQDISVAIKQLEAQLKEQEQQAENPVAEQTVSVSPFVFIDEHNLWRDDYTIRVLTPTELPLWIHFLAQSHTGLSSHEPAWLELIQQSFGHESIVLAAFNAQNAIIGGIPLTLFSSRLFGRFSVSVPFLNYGGLVTDYFDIARALMQQLAKVREDLNLSHIEVRSMQAGFAENPLQKKVSMILELPETNERLEKQLGTKVRAQYRKAEEYAPSCKTGKEELLDDFYAVFSRNMRDLGTPVYSKRWFLNILRHPGITSSIIIVYMAGKPVSAGFLTGKGNMLEIPWASTLQSANRKNANMWMYRQILAYAIEKGYRLFDFGRSTMGAGTYKFKKQWGAEPFQHYWYYVLPAGAQQPQLNPDNPKLKLFIALWKLMPVWLTKIIGPFVIRNLP